MYSAYQSGQSGSASPVRSSCSPCAAAARRSAAARSAADVGSARRHPAGQPGGDLLDQPGVAVRVAERERTSRSWRGPGPGRHPAAVPAWWNTPPSSWNTSLTSAPRAASSARAASMSFTTSCRPSGGAGRSRGDPRAEDDRALGARRRQLDHAEVRARGEVGVQPPPEAAVEVLGPVHVRDRHDHDLELHVHDRVPLLWVAGRRRRRPRTATPHGRVRVGPVAPVDTLARALVRAGARVSCSGLPRQPGGPVGQRRAQLAAGADAELGEHLAQVVLDGARADEQLGADLRVREARRGPVARSGPPAR